MIIPTLFIIFAPSLSYALFVTGCAAAGAAAWIDTDTVNRKFIET